MTCGAVLRICRVLQTFSLIVRTDLQKNRCECNMICMLNGAALLGAFSGSRCIRQPPKYGGQLLEYLTNICGQSTKGDPAVLWV